jgi:hypothetical protein
MKGATYKARHCTVLLPLRSTYLLSTLFSNTLKLCSFLSVKDQVSHPYKTIGKIMFLHILISTFFREATGKQKTEQNDSNHFPNLICH